MSTVEAIQANLEGLGFILFPGSPDDPPDSINDVDLVAMEQYRVFERANPNAPVFYYRREHHMKRWTREEV